MKTPETRRNAYAYTLLGCVIVIAIIGLLNIWGAGIGASFTTKSIFSLVVVACLCGFLYTLTYNHDKKFVKQLGLVTGIAATGLSALILGQIWFEIFNNAFFGKLAFTLLIIGGLAGFGIAMADDFFESKKLKDENYLD